MASKALLNKIARARASKGGNNIKDGKYTFEVKKILQEKKENGEMFIVELLCLESTAQPGNFELAGQAVWPDKAGAIEVKPNPVGSSPSYIVNLDTNKSAGGNVKSFVLALIDGEDFSEEEEKKVADFVETVDELIGPTQPARGMRISAETFRKPIKAGPNAGKPFVGINWTYFEQSVEDIAARRAALDKAEREAKDAS